MLQFGLMPIFIILSDTMLSQAKLPFKVDTSYKAVLQIIKEIQPALEDKNLTNASALLDALSQNETIKKCDVKNLFKAIKATRLCESVTLKAIDLD
ncbi:hypothetical protein [Pantoea phytobeneficialis]|uniref:Uncharacterized protein n=1 Tax=Pantoea phytobeneficialis TaxID=2052056 RepID=A0AAP9KRX9_9GAMM|nr:hypothetical protein [Pantoea phytobeneficialis]MDO6407431.1 hypothetical protein [Pantoea phytobeneficialis]QGR09520.1 hypothetical protein CTZ24_23925 [Pantoea phytobeneficialis]